MLELRDFQASGRLEMSSHSQELDHFFRLFRERLIDCQGTYTIRPRHLKVVFYWGFKVRPTPINGGAAYLPKTLIVPSFMTEYKVNRSSVRRRNAVRLISFSGSSVNSYTLSVTKRRPNFGIHLHHSAVTHEFASVQFPSPSIVLSPPLSSSAVLVRFVHDPSCRPQMPWHA